MNSQPPSLPASNASALRSWLLAAKSAVDKRGVDADALLREVGLDLSTLSDPMARYAHVVTDAADVRFHLDEGAGRLTITGDQALLSTANAATVWSIFDYAMLTLVRGSRMLYGRDFVPLELRLQRQRPKDHARFEKVFRCTPIYGCNDNALVVDHTTLHKALSFANLAVVKASEEAMDRYRSHWPDRGLPQQLAAVLKELLPSGEPRQDDVAPRLAMTLRTLQRRLAELDTSYRDVLNQTRHQLALDYLAAAQYSVGEISFLLGFSEVSAFTRAFKRWTGTSPSTWRQAAAPTLPPHAH